MKSLKTALFISMLSLAGAAQPAWSQTYQSHASITAAVQNFLTAEAQNRSDGQVAVEINPLDRRLQLTRCQQPLTITLAPGARLQGATSTRVSCPGNATWSIYVTGKISIYGYALVARRTLNRGETLSSSDVQLVEKDLTNLHYGFYSEVDEVLGQQATRALPAGQVLTPSSIKPPLLIRRGDQVTLMAEIGGIEVSMMGEALNDGIQGQRLRVRALNSKRVVEGQVISANVVKVTL